MTKEERLQKFRAEHPEARPEANPCNIETCDRFGSTRGLCSKHYFVARNLIKARKCTVQQLEEKGVLSPPKRKGTLMSANAMDILKLL